MKERQKCLPLWLLIFLCIIAVSLLSVLLIVFLGHKSWFPALAYLIVAAAITVGGCIAYHHLTIIRGTERAAVLTNLDVAWMGSELEKSRTAFLKFKNDFKKINGSRKREAFIKRKLRTYQKSEHETYRQLMGMVAFFETLGYFSRVGYILPEDALELYGPSIKQNDEAFRSHILELQLKEKDDSIYSNFIWLANELKLK